MRDLLQAKGPFRHRNVRHYAWFTFLYNARAYYPVMALLFLDLGLSLDQFILLNTFWALAILVLEVPSGALADLFGRRILVISAALLMSAEMLLLLLAPVNGGWILFLMCVANRLLSGTSEAAASGADQALAYDTLVENKEEHLWDQVLADLMQFRSLGFFLAMILGSLLYDPRPLAYFVPALGELDRTWTLRLPLALVFLQSLACLRLALQMEEPSRASPISPPTDQPEPSFRSLMRQTLRAARWVVRTPLALQVVLGALLLDSFARNFATLTAKYLTAISLPAYLLGIASSLFAITGLFIPAIMKRLTNRYNTRTNLLIISIWALLSLWLLAPLWPWWGLLPALGVLSVMSATDYLSSRELNRLSTSEQRATVLSVKGLSLNLGYGLVTLLFSLSVAYFQRGHQSENQALQTVLTWQPAVLAGLFIAFFLATHRIQQAPPTLHAKAETSTPHDS